MAITNTMSATRHMLLFFTAGIILLQGCKETGGGTADKYPDSLKIFHLLKPELTNVDFRNDIPEDENTNPLVYEYTYNGGGVAVGDVNKDGLDDIYFTANKKDNKLYINKGNLSFSDVTDTAGVKGRPDWKTGVTMADVNGDSWLDIYVCYSGNAPGLRRQNELFINQGNNANGLPSFREAAKQFGLADSAFSTQAAFFDYDVDGDLDMLLLNHSPRRFENLDDTYIRRIMQTPDSLTGVKLYRNDNNHFKDITASTGINNTRLSYGLGVSVADINNDGYPDIYISNDYLSPDFLYINNRDGSFTDRLGTMLSYTSQFSMGNDVADINNDGLVDICTMDMLPPDNHRQKLLFANDNYELFELRKRTGLHAQYMRNMLHLNNGDGSFSEIGQLAGISNTDWSWAPLFADYDNDGWKDLFITNGYLHDYTNMDFLKFMGDYLRDHQGGIQKGNLLELVREMPSSNVVNKLFKNNGDATFASMDSAWGITGASNSNGAAYSDLDNDGDMDLVINNINEYAFIYRNDQGSIYHNSFLNVKLDGAAGNNFGVGAKVIIYSGGRSQLQEQLMCRGFQSSVSPVLHFGLGKSNRIDSLHVKWLSGKEQWLREVQANRQIVLREANAKKTMPLPGWVIQQVFTEVQASFDFSHRENPVNDFKRQPLMMSSLSYSGPCIAKGDINHDGREDIFIGGPTGQAANLFVQEPNGSFMASRQLALEADLLYEDTDAAFFDADGDGDLDLYVCSGGYDNFKEEDLFLQDRLYLNDGRGRFSRSATALPRMLSSSSCVRVSDINGDGKPDLFVGGRVIPGRYPEAPRSYLLMNAGAARFEDLTQSIAPALMRLGMITDARWVDINNDKKPDLVTAGDWMPLQVWINTDGKLVDQTSRYFAEKQAGCWNRLFIADLNSDGHADILAGNFGLNTQCKVSTQQPGELYYKDFDENGSVDPVLCFYLQGKSYPYVSRDEMLDQISAMRTRFTDYKGYASAGMKDIFTDEELKDVNKLHVNTMETKCFFGSADGPFREAPLPVEAQYSPVYAIDTIDYDKDGKQDILLGGNIFHTRIKFGSNKANRGILLKGNGKGNFSFVPPAVSGLSIDGDIRSFARLNNTLMVGINDGPTRFYTIGNDNTARQIEDDKKN